MAKSGGPKIKHKPVCNTCLKPGEVTTTLILNWNKGHKRKDYVVKCEGCRNE